jgi:phosphoribosylamine--glycine ligase
MLGLNIQYGKFITCGGRVLGIALTSEYIGNAITKVYSNIKFISFKNMHYRKDIGKFLHYKLQTIVDKR